MVLPPIPITSALIEESCVMGNGLLCTDYCQNKNPSRFNFSGDASCSNSDNSFQCLSNQQKLESFCDCQDITSLNCSIEDNIERCTDFCTGGGEYSRYVASNSVSYIDIQLLLNLLIYILDAVNFLENVTFVTTQST